jgi:hypothetical protein
LDNSLVAVDWLLKLEELEQKKTETERSIRDLRLSRLPSNNEIQIALFDVLVTGTRERSQDERLRRMASFVTVLEEALTSNYAARLLKLGQVGPELREIYNYYGFSRAAEDFKALNRPDNSVSIDKQISELENEVKKIDRQLEGHRGNVLRCFCGGSLPRTLGETLHDAETALHSGRPMDEVGELILRKFGRDWRQRAVLFAEPVSIHGTSIASMTPDRRKIWLNAYGKMGLEANLKTPYFQATFEARRTEAPIPKGQFFDRSKPVATPA